MADRTKKPTGTARAAKGATKPTTTKPLANKRGRPTQSDVVRQLEATGSLTTLPDGPTDADGLTLRQRRILQVIKETVDRRGYPPSIREMGDAVGLASSSSVAHQLKVLEGKGYLRRDPNRPRRSKCCPRRRAWVGWLGPGRDRRDRDRRQLSRAGACPRAGANRGRRPILAEERIEDVFALPRQLIGEGTMFLLEVRGTR